MFSSNPAMPFFLLVGRDRETPPKIERADGCHLGSRVDVQGLPTKSEDPKSEVFAPQKSIL